jgi:ABC-type dipeptide/oligopeptide/nickel transport system permease subunit
MRSAAHVIVAPGLAVAVTVLAVSLLGEGLARAAARGEG